MTKQTRFGLTLVLPCFLLFGASAEAASSINLAWDRNSETTVAGYIVSYGTTAGQYTQTVDVTNNISWSLSVTNANTVYYFRVQAYNTQGLKSAYSTEVSGSAASTTGTAGPTERLVFGLTPYGTNGGWFAARNSLPAGLSGASWTQLPFQTYNATGGATHVAAGDVDGDGLDELVVGLGKGGAGWIAVLDDAAHGFALLKWIQVAWPTYNAGSGEVWPAVGDLDGDGRAEIVAGLGNGGGGWYEIFDDASANYAHLTWRQIPWPTYNTSGAGSTHPAIGNVDGTGASEIILGLGTGSAGWIEVVGGTAANYAHRSWFQVNYATYNGANGTTFPAAGNIDADANAEIVIGLGAGGGGWLEVADDTGSGFTALRWIRVSWPNYISASTGETHPAVGDIDGDSQAEIVVGLGNMTADGGWFETFDGGAAGNPSLGWRNVDWTAFKAAGGGLFPAIGKFR